MRHLNEEDLQLLITLDDPGDAQEEHTFNHLQAENIVAWPGQPFPATERHDHRAEAVIQNNLKSEAVSMIIMSRIFSASCIWVVSRFCKDANG